MAPRGRLGELRSFICRDKNILSMTFGDETKSARDAVGNVIPAEAGIQPVSRPPPQGVAACPRPRGFPASGAPRTIVRGNVCSARHAIVISRSTVRSSTTCRPASGSARPRGSRTYQGTSRFAPASSADPCLTTAVGRCDRRRNHGRASVGRRSLQGLPGVGPALARRLFARLGSVEHVMTADTAAGEVRGIGPRKAARIRELVRG